MMPVAFDNLSAILSRCPHFDLLRTLYHDRGVCIVGGALRDALLNRPISDLDLISPTDPTPLAKKFAGKIGGHWFWLDKERLQSRVVVGDADKGLSYDFALFRAVDLHHDLLDRDFTINALALPLNGPLSVASLVDPFGGLEDFREGRLRMLSASSLHNDPLRIIKGIRHATALGLTLDPATLESMQANLQGLEHIAPERIRAEIWKILDDPSSAQGLQLLADSNVGTFLFGPTYPGSLNRLFVRLAECRRVWQLLEQDDPGVSDWLSIDVEQGLTLKTLLMLVFLFLEVDPDLPVALGDTWRLSRKAKTCIAAVAALPDDIVQELANVALCPRAFAWWATRYHVEPKPLLLAIAVLASSPGQPLPEELHPWVGVVHAIRTSKPADLVDGHWLRDGLKLSAGPEMTKALELLRNAEIRGEVKHVDEAKLFLSRHFPIKD